MTDDGDALRSANAALEARVHELDTLFELAQAFGAASERDRVLGTLRNAVLGQFAARCALVLLAPPEGPPEVAFAHGTALPGASLVARLAALDAPVFEGLDEFALAVPLRPRGTRRGVVALGPRATGRPYTPADARLLESIGLLAVGALDRAALVEGRIAGERLEAEVRLARRVQERLMPTETPAVPGLDAAALALPSREVAGDTFDLTALGDGRLLLAVADVAGKGMPAALLMANLQACLRVVAPGLDAAVPDLAAATARVNAVVCASTEPTDFITLAWGVLDARTGRLVYVNAGHPPPLVVRADGRVEPMEAGGLLLGVLPDAPYAQGETTLQPGDLVALFTDGIPEARDRADREDYGEGRLAACLVAHRAESAASILACVRADVDRFTSGAPLADDLTLVVVRRTE